MVSLPAAVVQRASAQGPTQIQTSGAGSTNRASPEIVVLPKPLSDPLEPLNRLAWTFNRGLFSGVIKPTSIVYRFFIRKPVRVGIANFGRNVTYPVRLINTLLQGRWSGARDESYRFVCNSTVGVAGIFDVSTRWKIPKAEADFGQTLGRWGWDPAWFLMLPVYGPSNERDVIGLAADTAANPLLYISPYHIVARNPLTWLGPYTYLTYAILYNGLVDSVDEFSRFTRAESDPYSTIQFAWGFARKTIPANFHVTGESDAATLETLGASFFAPKDPGFLSRGKTRSASIPSTKRNLKFTFWLQPDTAPVVYIIPGLGSHRLAQGSIALAELVYHNGYSAVCVSGAFNSEFMEHASTVAMPAYLPADGHDLHVALTEIDNRLQSLYPHRFGGRALMGYSMGALHGLYIAATETTNAPGLVAFDRYVAIDTPVRVLHGMSELDALYRAPLDWPPAERMANMENTLAKVAELSKTPGPPKPGEALPFSGIESRFLIGLAFRSILKDIIFSSQRRSNQGVLRHSISKFRRNPLYQEILQYSYQDYFEKFAIPYYQKHGLESDTAGTLEKGGDLRTYTDLLRANRNIRVIVNRNDFLLTEEDLAWLQSTFGPESLTVFDRGGHIGNLASPPVQQRILESLGGLKR